MSDWPNVRNASIRINGTSEVETPMFEEGPSRGEMCEP